MNFTIFTLLLGGNY